MESGQFESVLVSDDLKGISAFEAGLSDAMTDSADGNPSGVTDVEHIVSNTFGIGLMSLADVRVASSDIAMTLT